MRSIGRSALALAGTAVAVLLGIDVMMSTLIAPPMPTTIRQGVLVAHAIFHVAVLILSFVGAVAGFACVRRRLATPRQAAILGGAFGLASVFGGAIVLVAESPWLAGLWLGFGAMAFAIGGALFHKPWRAEGHT